MTADNKQAIEYYGGEFQFSQDADSMVSGFQELTVGVSDAGGGKFYYIKTERWSFDTPEQLLEIINKVQKFVKENDNG